MDFPIPFPPSRAFGRLHLLPLFSSYPDFFFPLPPSLPLYSSPPSPSQPRPAEPFTLPEPSSPIPLTAFTARPTAELSAPPDSNPTPQHGHLLRPLHCIRLPSSTVRPLSHLSFPSSFPSAASHRIATLAATTAAIASPSRTLKSLIRPPCHRTPYISIRFCRQLRPHQPPHELIPSRVNSTWPSPPSSPLSVLRLHTEVHRRPPSSVGSTREDELGPPLPRRPTALALCSLAPPASPLPAVDLSDSPKPPALQLFLSLSSLFLPLAPPGPTPLHHDTRSSPRRWPSLFPRSTASAVSPGKSASLVSADPLSHPRSMPHPPQSPCLWIRPK